MRVFRAAPAGRHSMLAAVALALGAAALAGCGSSSSSSSSATTSSTPANTTTSTPASSTPVPGTTTSGAQKLSIAANPEGQLKYDTSSLTAKAGTATVAFTNAAPLEHNLTIASSSGSVVGATPTFQGGSKTLTVKLAAGTYKFYCTVPGHRAAGMEGTLTVK
jgi:plastocyanin